MKPIKIRIRNEKHSEMVQKMLFAVGCKWPGMDGARVQHEDKPHMYVNVDGKGRITYGYTPSIFEEREYQEVNFDWLLPVEHTITIDGKEIKISEESFNELKKQLMGE